MEPNTNEATAPKRLKTGGKKPIIIIGVIVAVLLAAYVGLCAYANSLARSIAFVPCVLWSMESM